MDRRRTTDIPGLAFIASIFVVAAGAGLQGCGIFAFTSPGSAPAGSAPAGGGAGGGAGQALCPDIQPLGAGGPEGPLYFNPIPPPGDAKNEKYLAEANWDIWEELYGFTERPKEWMGCPPTFGTAAAKISGGGVCGAKCYQVVHECEQACVEFHEKVKDNPHKSNKAVDKLANIPCPKAAGNDFLFIIYSWQACYKGVNFCEGVCETCTWPMELLYLEDNPIDAAWDCRCPDGLHPLHEGSCSVHPGKDDIFEDCETDCRRKIIDCRDDMEEAYVYKHGVLSDAAYANAEKKCMAKFKGCFKKCPGHQKTADDYFDAAVTGNASKFKKALKWVMANKSVHFGDGDRRSALHHAAMHGHLAIVKILVDEGATIWVDGAHGTSGWMFPVDVGGKNALDLARENGHMNVVEYLEGLPAP